MTTQLQKQREESFDHIFEWAEDEFVELADLFTKKKSEIVLETARKLDNAGFETEKISNEISNRLSGYVSADYVRHTLEGYPQYKDQKQKSNSEKGKSGGYKTAKSTASERPPIELPGDGVTVEPVAGTQEEPVTTQNIRKMAENILDLSPTNTQPNNKTIEQPGPKEVQGRHNIAPEQFKIDELEEYDHDLLVDIVRYLHNKVQDRKIELLQKENAALKKENEQYKRLPNNDALYNTIDLLKKENAELRKQFQDSNTTAGVPQEPNQKQEWLLGK